MEPNTKRPPASRKLHCGHFAFMRAIVQGLDHTAMWDRYLNVEGEVTDLRVVKRTLRWIREEFSRISLKAGKPGTARLLRLHVPHLGNTAGAPTLSTFAEERGLEDLSEIEQLAAWRSEYGQPGARAQAVGRLIQRQLRALLDLENMAGDSPGLGDEIGAWFSASITGRLQAAGIMTLHGLVGHIDRVGPTWWHAVPGLGEVKAARILSWLDTWDQSLGRRVVGHSRGAWADLGHPQQASTLTLASDVAQAGPEGSWGLLAPAPFERLQVPRALSGEHGVYRRTADQCLLNAADDYAAVKAWLDGHRGHTARAYRKEAERLLLWALVARNKPLSSLAREDLLAYRDFLADPRPREQWCAPRNRPRMSPIWRPFEGPLSDAARAHALQVIRGLFDFLVRQGYLVGNPAVGVQTRMPTSLRQQFSRRLLSRDDWGFVRGLVASGTPAGLRLGALLDLLYATGLRLSEVQAARFDDLDATVDSEGDAVWLLRIVGKGHKFREVPVPDSIVSVLIKLAIARGVTEPAGTKSLLIGRLPGAAGASEAGQGLSAGVLARLVKTHFERASRRTSDPKLAERLRRASTHWTRHAHASHALDAGVDLVAVQQNLGHASLTTTTAYVSAEQKKRATQMKRLWAQDVPTPPEFQSSP
jgi:site-specific recombinase XerD